MSKTRGGWHTWQTNTSRGGDWGVFVGSFETQVGWFQLWSNEPHLNTVSGEQLRSTQPHLRISVLTVTGQTSSYWYDGTRQLQVNPGVNRTWVYPSNLGNWDPARRRSQRPPRWVLSPRVPATWARSSHHHHLGLSSRTPTPRDDSTPPLPLPCLNVVECRQYQTPPNMPTIRSCLS